jgi:hypothetical protein
MLMVVQKRLKLIIVETFNLIKLDYKQDKRELHYDGSEVIQHTHTSLLGSLVLGITMYLLQFPETEDTFQPESQTTGTR